MTIRFVLLVNKQGQTRLAQYYEYLTIDERRALEGEIVRKCLARADNQCSFVEHRNYKIIYRRYASLFFLVGVDGEENELAILEFIHCVVETMDRYFGNVCELDIMFHLEKAHFMLEEMVMNGCIVETNKVEYGGDGFELPHLIFMYQNTTCCNFCGGLNNNSLTRICQLKPICCPCLSPEAEELRTEMANYLLVYREVQANRRGLLDIFEEKAEKAK